MKYIKLKTEMGIEGLATPFFHEGHHRRTSQRYILSLQGYRVARKGTQAQQQNEYCLISGLFSSESSPKES